MIQTRHIQRLALLCPTQVEPSAALEEVLNEVWALRVLSDWRRVNGRSWYMTTGEVCELQDVCPGNPYRMPQKFSGRWARLEAAEWIVDHVPDMYHWRESR